MEWDNREINVGDLVTQRHITHKTVGIVLVIKRGRGLFEYCNPDVPDFLYEYAVVQWHGEGKTYRCDIKTSLLEKVS